MTMKPELLQFNKETKGNDRRFHTFCGVETPFFFVFGWNADVAQTPSSEEDYTIELTFVEYNREKLARPVTFLIIYQRLEGRIMNETHQINRSPEEKQLQSLTETTKMIGCSGSLWEALWLRSV